MSDSKIEFGLFLHTIGEGNPKFILFSKLEYSGSSIEYALDLKDPSLALEKGSLSNVKEFLHERCNLALEMKEDVAEFEIRIAIAEQALPDIKIPVRFSVTDKNDAKKIRDLYRVTHLLLLTTLKVVKKYGDKLVSMKNIASKKGEILSVKLAY